MLVLQNDQNLCFSLGIPPFISYIFSYVCVCHDTLQSRKPEVRVWFLPKLHRYEQISFPFSLCNISLEIPSSLFSLLCIPTSIIRFCRVPLPYTSFFSPMVFFWVTSTSSQFEDASFPLRLVLILAFARDFFTSTLSVVAPFFRRGPRPFPAALGFTSSGYWFAL